MDNINKNNAKRKALQEISKIIADPSFFKLLISNRGANYRRPMYKRLNELFPPGKTEDAWKKYFLYPEKIPSTGMPLYVKAMEEMLNLQLQIMEDDLTKEAIELNEKRKSIENILLKVETFKILHHGQK